MGIKVFENAKRDINDNFDMIKDILDKYNIDNRRDLN